MFNTNSKGAVSVETVCVLAFFVVFLMLLQRVSVLSAYSHNTAIRLQNSTERMMMERGRPVCLNRSFSDKYDPENGEYYEWASAPAGIFGERIIAKKLIFTTIPICDGG